jgi:Flp pilus assembly protein TadG
MSPALKSMMRKLRRARVLGRKVLADSRGVAAIEFAMLLPIMLVLFFGTVEFSAGVATNRKVSLVAQTLSDLTSRSISVSTTDLTNFSAAGTAIMTPYLPPIYNQTNSTVSELWIDASGNARVQWSWGTSPRGTSTFVTIPTNLIVLDPTTHAVVPGQYLIFSEVQFLYQPVVDFMMSRTTPRFNWTTVSYTRPRQGVCVIYPTPSSGPLPACPTL